MFQGLVLLLVSICFVNTARASTCDGEALLLNIKKVDVQFKTWENIDHTIKQAIAAVDKSGRSDEILTPLHMKFRGAMTRLIGGLVYVPREDPKFWPDYDKAMFRMKTNSSAYTGRDVVSSYWRYASAFQEFLSRLLVEYAGERMEFDRSQPLNVLDLGSGVGDTALAIQEHLPGSLITVSDKTLKLLIEARRRVLGLEARQRWVPGVGLDFSTGLPFKNDSFHLIVSVCALGEYLSATHFENFLDEAHRILKPGGYLLFEFAPHTIAAGGLSLADFLKKMSALGFQPEAHIDMEVLWKGQKGYPVLLRKRAEALLGS